VMWREKKDEKHKDCSFEARAFPAIEILAHECGTPTHNPHAADRSGNNSGNRANLH